MKKNLLLVPWQRDFLSALLDHVLETAPGTAAPVLERAVFIFPHERPEKYLVHLLKSHPRAPRPLVLPECHAVRGLFSVLRQAITGRAAWNAGLLDRVGLLLECTRRETDTALLLETRDATAAKAGEEARLFFPWGVRLASLFEECMVQGRPPESFPYAEDLVTPFAARLLERLGGIFSRYIDGLERREWTTPGYDALRVNRHLADGGAFPERFFQDRRILIAGFHTLTGAEDRLFRHLWEIYGADVLVHADPALASSARPHWSCRNISRWADAWRAGIVPVSGADAAPCPAARTRYVEGFDLHSQLSALREELHAPEQDPAAPEADAAGPCSADTAVVLADSALLVPALHHVPVTDINISMGFPLRRSPLFRLLDTILRLQERRRDTGYYWRDLIELARHPYLKMLAPDPAPVAEDSFVPGSSPDTLRDAADSRLDPPAAATPEMSLRRELHRFEQTVRNFGSTFMHPLDVLEQMDALATPEEAPAPAVRQLLADIFTACLVGLEQPEHPRHMADALENLCLLLLRHGSHLWSRFPIDAECLYRIMQSLIPELARSALSEERFPSSTLFAMTRELMEEERVPFEAAPLVGLQLLGVLETRLLTFRRVIVLEATEDVLPGGSSGDPLLPEALRPLLGLPDLHGREQIAAYHFFRLLAGARDVLLLWQEGGEATGLLDRKKKKSRFVEELLWEEEKKLGRLLRGNDGPLRVLAARTGPLLRSRLHIPVSLAVRQRMHALLEQPVSASLLDGYLRCPVRFYHERLAGLRPTEEVLEDQDPLAVGRLFHATLEEFYQRRCGTALCAAVEDPGLEEELLDTFHAQPGLADLRTRLPADAYAMLACSGEERLRRYLRGQPETRVLALEHSFTLECRLAGRGLTLTGTADRIDLRGEECLILDYKTGTSLSPAPGFWTARGLWTRMEEWDAGTGDSSLLAELAEKLGSVQMPLYLHLLAACGRPEHGPDIPVGPDAPRVPVPADRCNAAWVALEENGDEKPFFRKSVAPEERAAVILEHTVRLLDFLVRHMTRSDVLSPHPGAHCRWCSCQNACMILEKDVHTTHRTTPFPLV